MRVARGLFRLWIVFSVVWVGAVVIVAWKTLPVDDWVPVTSVEHGPWEDYRPKPLPQDLAQNPPAFDPSKPYKIVRDSERREAIQFACLAALVPPALALAFGSALAWAFRGFQT
jgi:hypothetical protein